MANLSPKQLGMSWINQKLEPSRINPEYTELQEINGGPIKPEVFKKAQEFIFNELAKMKVRYNDYALKYSGELNDSNTDDPETSSDKQEE